jgi:hypothetical protein
MPFGQEAISQFWIVPYLHMSGPDLLLYFVVGLFFPLLFRPFGVLRGAIWFAVAVLVIQAVLFALFSSYWASDWRGYAVMTAPFVGMIVGFAAGMGVSLAISRFTRAANSASVSG